MYTQGRAKLYSHYKKITIRLITNKAIFLLRKNVNHIIDSHFNGVNHVYYA